MLKGALLCFIEFDVRRFAPVKDFDSFKTDKQRNNRAASGPLSDTKLQQNILRAEDFFFFFLKIANRNEDKSFVEYLI